MWRVCRVWGGALRQVNTLTQLLRSALTFSQNNSPMKVCAHHSSNRPSSSPHFPKTETTTNHSENTESGDTFPRAKDKRQDDGRRPDRAGNERATRRPAVRTAHAPPRRRGASSKQRGDQHLTMCFAFLLDVAVAFFRQKRKATTTTSACEAVLTRRQRRQRAASDDTAEP